MSEPWRIAVVGSLTYPDANRRIYARLKMLRADWPKATIHILTGMTGTVSTAAVRAARKLRWEYSQVNDHSSAAERVIAFWDFKDADTAGCIRDALLRDIHVEVWDLDDNPAGPLAADTVQGIA